MGIKGSVAVACGVGVAVAVGVGATRVGGGAEGGGGVAVGAGWEAVSLRGMNKVTAVSRARNRTSNHPRNATRRASSRMI